MRSVASRKSSGNNSRGRWFAPSGRNGAAHTASTMVRVVGGPFECPTAKARADAALTALRCARKADWFWRIPRSLSLPSFT